MRTRYLHDVVAPDAADPMCLRPGSRWINTWLPARPMTQCPRGQQYSCRAARTHQLGATISCARVIGNHVAVQRTTARCGNRRYSSTKTTWPYVRVVPARRRQRRRDVDACGDQRNSLRYFKILWIATLLSRWIIRIIWIIRDG